MAEKEEVASLVVSIEADTSDFNAEMNKLAAKAATVGGAITKGLSSAAFGGPELFSGLDAAINELAGNFTKVTAAAETSSSAIQRLFGGQPIAIADDVQEAATAFIGLGGSTEQVVADMRTLLTTGHAATASVAAGAEEAARAMQRAAIGAGNYKAQLLGLGAGAAAVWAPYLNTTAKAVEQTRALAATTAGMSAGMAGVWGPVIAKMNETSAATKQVAAAVETIVPASARAAAEIKKIGTASRDAIKGTTFLTSNLVAQFQDVGVQIAAGTSPLQIALQQGTQMALVFNNAADAGATLGQRLALVGGALKTLISPATLIPIALIAAGAAAVQFFQTSKDKGKEAEEALKLYHEVLKDIHSAFGVTTDDLEKFADKNEDLVRAELLTALITFTDKANTSTQNLLNSLGKVSRFATQGFAVQGSAEFEEAFGAISDPALINSIKGLSVALRSGEPDLQAWIDHFNALNITDPGIAKQRQEIVKLLTEARSLPEIIDALTKAQDRLENNNAFKNKEEQVKKFKKAMEELRDLDPLKESTIEKFERLEAAIRAANKSGPELVGALREFFDIRDRFIQNEQDMFDTKQLEGFHSKFTALIEDVEGFRTTPYNDPSAAQKRRGETDLAIGFGMHQLIDDAGKRQDIINGMVISEKEAATQLARQWKEIYFPEVMKALGPETWEKLDENMQAAIASIVWNFGHLPASIKKAAQTFDPQELSKAILQLPGSDVRHAKESAMALGKAYTDVIQDEIDAAKKAKKEHDKYILTLENEAAVTNLHNKLIFEGTFEQEKQTFILKEQLKAKEQNIKLSEADNAQIEKNAVLTANAAVAKETHTEATRLNNEETKRAAQINSELARQQRALQHAFDAVSSQIENAFVDAIFNGEKLNDVIKDLTRSLAQMALKAALGNFMSQLFGAAGGTSPGGGFLGSIIGAIGGKPKLPGLTAPAAAFGGASGGSSAMAVNVTVAPSPLLITQWDKKAAAAENRAVARGPAVARANSQRFSTP